MSISETVFLNKDGEVERFPLFQKFFLSLIIILVALLSFGIGRLSVAGNREPIKIEYDPQQASVINTVKPSDSIVGEESVITSKNGTRYHYPYCAGAKQIKEENKIVFSSPAAAEAAGYTLAVNCQPK